MSFDTLLVMKIPNDQTYGEGVKKAWNNKAILVDTSPLLRTHSNCPTSCGSMLSRRNLVELCTKLEAYKDA